jgi:hypothetical protein
MVVAWVPASATNHLWSQHPEEMAALLQLVTLKVLALPEQRVVVTQLWVMAVKAALPSMVAEASALMLVAVVQ